MMKKTINVSQPLHHELKLLSVHRNQPIQEVIEQILKQYFQSKKDD